MGLRAALSRCTAKTDWAEQPALVKSLRQTIPHTVKPLERGQENVNCFMYALEIAPAHPALYYAHHPDLALPKDCLSEFARFLLDCGAAVRVSPPQAQVGDLVLYSWHGRVQHAGRLVSCDRAASKWGTGWVWEHGIFEVPVTYGNRAEFARPVPPERLEPAFLLFVWNRARVTTRLPSWFLQEIAPLLAAAGLAKA